MKYNIIYADPPWQFKEVSRLSLFLYGLGGYQSTSSVRHRSRRLYLVFVGDISLVKRGA